MGICWSIIVRVKVFIQKHFDSPVRRNIIANLFGVGVTLLNQVVLVPFYFELPS